MNLIWSLDRCIVMGIFRPKNLLLHLEIKGSNIKKSTNKKV
jgi:hypothetical protein